MERLVVTASGSEINRGMVYRALAPAGMPQQPSAGRDTLKEQVSDFE